MSQTFGASKFDQIVDGSITSIRSNVASIGEYAFYGCNQLESAAFPNVTSVGQYAFKGCSSLINLPVSGNIDFYSARNVFNNCTSLNSVHINGQSGQYMFENCTGLLVAVMTNANLSVWNQDFKGCTSLQTADIDGSGIQYFGIFSGCSSLTTVIIRRTTIQDLGYNASNNNFAFYGTPFASGGSGGTIYIPKSLYDHLGDGTSNDYKAKTNWATADALGTITWAQIEGSQYENYYADGTPVE